MDNSSINPILLSSAAHLENVEQLIKNLEKQTLDMDNFEDILSNRNRQEIITKSFSSVLTNGMAIDDTPDDNFLVRSIALTNDGRHDEQVSMDSLFNQRDLFDDDIKKQQTPPANDQSLLNDQEGGFTWDDQYDTRANYRLTFSTDKQQQMESKTDKHHRHKDHRHHRHRHHKNRTTDSQSNSIYSDEGLSANNMNDWSMRSSSNTLDQSIDQRDNKATATQQQQQSFIRSQSHPASFSSQQQQQQQQQLPNNQSPNSSTSSSSSASWRRMKESQRTTSGIETKEPRPPSPLSLYKIFQQKSQTAGSSSSPRSAFQYYRQQSDAIVPNNADSMTISGEKMTPEKSKLSHDHQRKYQPGRASSQTNSSTDQAIQTSIVLDSSLNSQMNSRFQSSSGTAPKSESYDYLSTQAATNTSNHLTVPPRPSPVPISSSAIHKSLPDLAFISQYSKELPRSRTSSPCPPTPIPSNSSSSINTTVMSPSPTMVLQQQKQESERPRTLKSIKRYKTSRHSTEPLGVFYSPQLRKTFAAVPASAVINGSNDARTIIKMKLPPSSSFQTAQQQALNLKSCLKYGSRASSCDIQAMLQERKSPAPTLAIPEPENNNDSISPSAKRRSSEADARHARLNNYTTGSSNDLDTYVLQDSAREHRSDYDLTAMSQQNQTKKSVSFSENIAKHLISPCNPAIQFDPPPEIFTDDDDDNYNETTTNNNNLALALHGNKEKLTRKVTARYSSNMRRCQTDIIVVDRVHHLHSFTESPPNEFRFQETDSLAGDREEDEDDRTIMEKTHINIIPYLNETVTTPPITNNPTVENMSSSNDKENKIPDQSISMDASTVTLIQTNDPFLDGLLEKISGIVKRIFEIKRADKTFFLSNEHNPQLDTLLKNDLCPTLQNILEHGLKRQQKDSSSTKQITIWKIVETSIDHGQSLQAFHDAKQLAQNTSSYWLYKFQAFIFALLNKNELINWLYHVMKQKEILQRYYQSHDALILTFTPSTFKLFDRIMTQLEKLSSFAFRLTYQPPPIPSDIDDQLNASTISMYSSKSSARDWVMTISRRTSKTLTQPIVLPSAAAAATATVTQPPTDTLRSTISRKINSLFTKTNPTAPQRKPSSAVTAKLPSSKPQSMRTASPAQSRRPPVSNVFANATAAATANKPVIVSSPKLNNGTRTGAIRRGISPSVVVAPSPPPTSGTASAANTTFQSKIPRPSLNVDKPKSARYRSTAPPPK